MIAIDFEPSPELARLATAYGKQLETISTFVASLMRRPQVCPAASAVGQP